MNKYVFVYGWKKPEVTFAKTRGQEVPQACKNSECCFQPGENRLRCLGIHFLYIQVVPSSKIEKSPVWVSSKNHRTKYSKNGEKYSKNQIRMHIHFLDCCFSEICCSSFASWCLNLFSILFQFYDICWWFFQVQWENVSNSKWLSTGKFERL